MRRLILRVVTLFFLAPWLASCVSNYNLKARAAHNAYHEGRYEEAVALINKVRPAGRDRLLYLLDKGMILHGAGKYEESNAVLTKAEELSEAFTAKSVSRETAATLWSEEATEYGGEKYERIMIPVIRMLNYIMEDEWDEALVEVRRLITTSEKIYTDPAEMDNAFALYLSAVVWETLGQINDALISLNQMTKHKLDVPYYGYDANLFRKMLGIDAPLPQKGGVAWTTSKNYRKQKGELIVIAETGRTPIFVAATVTNGLFTFSVPELEVFPEHFRPAKVLIDGREAGTIHPFYNIMKDILQAERDRQKRSFIRKMIKLPVQTGLYAAGGELMEEDDTKSKAAGLGLVLLALSMSAAEKADTRSWRTLPALFELGRFYLPEGRHRVELEPEGGGDGVEETVDVTSEKPSVLLVKLPQGTGAPAKLTTPQREGARQADIEKANEFLAMGEAEEEAQNYEDASYDYMLAYKYGLTDDSTAKRVIDTYTMTGDSFKKSERGLEIASQFAEIYLTYNPE
jgi:tetratricopeptide (TPR) repeat protein